MPAAPKLIRNAPVTSLGTIEALISFALTVLVTHGVIGSVDVGSTTQTIAPFVALALPAVFGAARWALVTPCEKLRGLAESQGVVSDADFARLESLVETTFESYLPKQLDTGADAPADGHASSDGNARSDGYADAHPGTYAEVDGTGWVDGARSYAVDSPRGMAAGAIGGRTSMLRHVKE